MPSLLKFFVVLISLQITFTFNLPALSRPARPPSPLSSHSSPLQIYTNVNSPLSLPKLTHLTEFSTLKQNQTIQTLVQVYNTTQTAAYVDCSIYTLTGSNKGRALRVLGLLRLNSLPKGVALENQPYFKAGTNIILGRGTTLPLNSVYIKEVQSSSKRFEVGIFFSDDKGRKVELERNEVDRKEKVLKRKAFKKRTSVNKVIVGWKRKGVVKEIREYGVILDCGFRRDVLVHVSSAAKFFEQRFWWRF